MISTLSMPLENPSNDKPIRERERDRKIEIEREKRF